MPSSEGFALLYGVAVLWGVSYLLYKGRSSARPVLDVRRIPDPNGNLLKGGMTPIKTLGMDDVGRRIDHLADLHSLWEFAYALLTTNNVWHTAVEQAQAEELEIGLKLLTKHMQTGYDSKKYAQEINSLPKNLPDSTGE